MKNISVFKFRFDSINMFSLMLNIGDKRVRNSIMLIKKKNTFCVRKLPVKIRRKKNNVDIQLPITLNETV